MNKKALSIIFLVIGGLALLPYPFMMIGNIMQIAGSRSGDESAMLIFVVFSFVIVSSLYLITYLVCLILAIVKRKRGILLISTIPLFHLLLLFALLLVWFLIE
ncbi:hypothetical protein [Paenibacillus aestuarii]|uniref:Uncharacterized protein n=1 Tax=Paenibacillus aestuarii TaxID=516965 RepID=A0ABW0KCB5_9BACL|nr:hypothetical protein [Paenibacillus aestuarii]